MIAKIVNAAHPDSVVNRLLRDFRANPRDVVIMDPTLVRMQLVPELKILLADHAMVNAMERKWSTRCPEANMTYRQMLSVFVF